MSATDIALSGITLALLLTTLVLTAVAGPAFWLAGRLLTRADDPVRWVRRLLLVGLFPVGLVSFGLSAPTGDRVDRLRES